MPKGSNILKTFLITVCFKSGKITKVRVWETNIVYQFFVKKLKKIRVCKSNWTEWSAIQGVIPGVIARVISKSDERGERSSFEITGTITPLIKTITKFFNVIGYQQPDFSINWTVAHVKLVIGQYASFCARCYGTLC